MKLTRLLVLIVGALLEANGDLKTKDLPFNKSFVILYLMLTYSRRKGKNMKLLTKELATKLVANFQSEEENLKPVVKFFGGGACTWLISEWDGNDYMFGLCDLGMGTPELGMVSYSELQNLRFPPFGLPVERDKFFKADKTIFEYAEIASDNQRIVA